MDIRRTWRSRLQRTFFGLSDDYQEAIYEEFFQLKYYGGWSLFEAYNLPIVIRRWFLRRLVEQKTKEAESQEESVRKAKSSRR